MAIPSGMNVRVLLQGNNAADRYVCFAGEGTYTAADFTIGAVPTYSGATQLTYGGLGFTPKKVRAINLTDRTIFEHFFDANLGTSNAEGLKTVAGGTVTYEASGLSVSGKNLTVDVSTTGITDNDDFIIECWGSD